VIEYLSPRECADMEAAAAKGALWPRVMACFLDDARLLLGWDRARSEDEIARLAGIAPASVRESIDEASRWCVARKLHLLGWQEEDGSQLHFMAVG
jgi:hypothetical protein